MFIIRNLTFIYKRRWSMTYRIFPSQISAWRKRRHHLCLNLNPLVRANINKIIICFLKPQQTQSCSAELHCSQLPIVTFLRGCRISIGGMITIIWTWLPIRPERGFAKISIRGITIIMLVSEVWLKLII